jgi:hypothetical protein
VKSWKNNSKPPRKRGQIQGNASPETPAEIQTLINISHRFFGEFHVVHSAERIPKTSQNPNSSKIKSPEKRYAEAQADFHRYGLSNPVHDVDRA